MAKENPDMKAKEETPFQRFEALVRQVVAVPKREVDEWKRKRTAKSSSRHLHG